MLTLSTGSCRMYSSTLAGDSPGGAQLYPSPIATTDHCLCL